MFEVLLDGIIFQFKDYKQMEDWIDRQDPNAVILFIDPIPIEDEKTVRYNEKQVCDYCNDGPVVEGECPVCQSGWEHFATISDISELL